jgi:hypothetical protein
MSNEFPIGPHLVKAFPPHPKIGTEFQVWAAATSVDKAAAAVLEQLGPGWKAELFTKVLTKEQASKIKLRPGAVCEVTQAL